MHRKAGLFISVIRRDSGYGRPVIEKARSNTQVGFYKQRPKLPFTGEHKCAVVYRGLLRKTK